MSKIAFVFPGQGAQYVGMAQDFYNNFSDVRDIFQQADERLGFGLSDIMFNGPADKLKETQYTQPAILLHSIIAMKKFMEEVSIKPEITAGHSLGEFSALVAANVLNLQNALYLVHKRGEFMVTANQGTPFKMAAIIGLSSEQVIEICQQSAKEKNGIVVPANFNTPTQTVISGEDFAVDKAKEIAKDMGAMKVIELSVGGPFHSPLIELAEQWLAKEMDNFQFNYANIPVVQNVNAMPSTEPLSIKENLKKQVVNPVQWVKSINYIIDNGVDTFIEFGPGKIVSGMIRRISRKATIMNVDKYQDIEKIKHNCCK
ncbi:MAG: [acyl-carrier-protein] S-malonyltransferase [Candidatus Cloacimonadota bacterium]|nr:MAG: [acyl-carrier-protein] S-malonyltransferase [Candidatus Cloacimonadota bacterium]